MSAVLTAFGIDWHLLLIDTINFGLLLVVLWYFLYKPVTAMIEKRRAMVAQGVIDADLAQKRLHEIEESRAGMLAKAGQESDALLAHARKSAEEKERDLIAGGERAAEALLREAQMQARELQHQALEKSREEVAKLIVLGIEKAIQK